MNLFGLFSPRRRPTPRTFRPRLERLEDRSLLAALQMTANEQLLIELINRARGNPAAEAALYGIDLNKDLPAGTISPDAKPPFAPHQGLILASGSHSQEMLDFDYFGHTGRDGSSPSDRAMAAGFPAFVSENVSWGGSTGPIDEIEHVGLRHRSLFLSAAHRINLFDQYDREVGVGVRYGQYTTNGTTYNSSMVTEVFGARDDSQYFITGVAFTDGVTDDDFYTVGEGIGGVMVTAVNQRTQASYSELTGTSGGYSLRVPSGTYTVTASGGGFAVPVQVANVAIAGANRKLDFNPPTGEFLVPVVRDDWANVTQDGSINLAVTANDSDPDSELDLATVAVTTPPASGQATVNPATGAITYMPAAGFFGLDSLQYTVRDNDGLVSSPATVRIFVNPAASTVNTNTTICVDVNYDLQVNPQDVLTLVNEINEFRSQSLPDSRVGAWLTDVNGDGQRTPQDVMSVISFLLRFGNVDVSNIDAAGSSGGAAGAAADNAEEAAGVLSFGGSENPLRAPQSTQAVPTVAASVATTPTFVVRKPAAANLGLFKSRRWFDEP